MGDDSGEAHSSSGGRELNAVNYRIRAEDRLGGGSLKQKCRDNFAAIELVNRLDTEGRAATADEKRVLVKYVGWGGIPQVFAQHLGTDWEGEREELRNLLTDSQYETARASTLNAHYTSATVVTAIYDAVPLFPQSLRLVAPILFFRSCRAFSTKHLMKRRGVIFGGLLAALIFS